ncbi:MAG: hypothetical protein FJ319_14045 [SAR202 cluster bacterium]|nr:hypothetical protein [SAR202 cluster bacterium]
MDDELRSIGHQLYRAILRRGLVPALQSLCDHFDSAIALDVRMDPELVRREKFDNNFVPEQVRLAGYRIAEEALTNVLKHSGASQVFIAADLRGGAIEVIVKDNGKGFVAEGSKNSLGLGTMRDYAEVVGGECAVRSVPGNGTTVVAKLPSSVRDEQPRQTPAALV